MIRLIRPIIQLRVLLKTERSLSNIEIITGSIMDACDILIKEHGRQEGITPLFVDIYNRAKTMGEDASQVNGKIGSPVFNIKQAVLSELDMEEDIKKIAEILRIELKEIGF